MLNQNIKKLFRLIEKSNKILLVTHRNPDGDALGSILAFHNFLVSQKKEHISFCKDQPGENFNYLQGIKEIQTNPLFLKKEYDLVITLDCAELEMTKFAEDIKKINPQLGTINIDHHQTNPLFANLNIVIPQASSTAEIIYQIFRIGKIKINSAIATALLTGIITDTGNFAYASTTKQAIETASHLLSIGADFKDITKANIYNKTINILKLWGIVLTRIAFDEKLSMVTTALFKEDLEKLQLPEEAGEGISNYLNNLSKDTKFSLLLKQLEPDTVKGSLRTTRDDIDVSQIAIAFGGGGHRKAAGFEKKGQLVLNNDQWQIIKAVSD